LHIFQINFLSLLQSPHSQFHSIHQPGPPMIPSTMLAQSLVLFANDLWFGSTPSSSSPTSSPPTTAFLQTLNAESNHRLYGRGRFKKYWAPVVIPPYHWCCGMSMLMVAIRDCTCTRNFPACWKPWWMARISFSMYQSSWLHCCSWTSFSSTVNLVSCPPYFVDFSDCDLADLNRLSLRKTMKVASSFDHGSRCLGLLDCLVRLRFVCKNPLLTSILQMILSTLLTMSTGGFWDAGSIILWIASTVWILGVRVWSYLEPSILHCSVQPAVVVFYPPFCCYVL